MGSTSTIAIRTTSNSKTEVPIMLLESGDLFPVIEEAVDIPWTKRKNLIANFLYRGSVTFQTLVYDSNVGDIAPLSMYFNPRKWTVFDLNQKFGQVADEDDRSETSSNLTIGPSADLKSATLLPRLVIFREKALKTSSELFSISSFPISVWTVPPPSVMVTPISTSKLPSPPKKSPPGIERSASPDDMLHPIAPPKRRKLSVIEESTLCCAVGHLKPKSASTSSPWTPLITCDSLSPFIFLESTVDVFDDNDNENKQDVKRRKNVFDETTLAASLRKIAKVF